MKESNHERVRAAVADVVGIVIFGLLMATVVEALSPENLLRNESGTPGAKQVTVVGDTEGGLMDHH